MRRRGGEDMPGPRQKLIVLEANGRKHLRKSPSEFLRGLRFNRIRHFLDKSDLPLPEIARRTGYGSAMSLSIAFRREYGIAPGEYRRTRRRKNSDLPPPDQW